MINLGWRASCMYLWDTPEGGPCFMRPTGEMMMMTINKYLILFWKAPYLLIPLTRLTSK